MSEPLLRKPPGAFCFNARLVVEPVSMPGSKGLPDNVYLEGIDGERVENEKYAIRNDERRGGWQKRAIRNVYGHGLTLCVTTETEFSQIQRKTPRKS